MAQHSGAPSWTQPTAQTAVIDYKHIAVTSVLAHMQSRPLLTRADSRHAVAAARIDLVDFEDTLIGYHVTVAGRAPYPGGGIARLGLVGRLDKAASGVAVGVTELVVG